MVPYKKNPNMIITIIHYGLNNVIYSYKYSDEPIKYKSCITLVIAKDLVMSILPHYQASCSSPSTELCFKAPSFIP